MTTRAPRKWTWTDTYFGHDKFSAGGKKLLERRLGAVASNIGINAGLIGGVARGKRPVAVPLFDGDGWVRSAVLVDPTGKAEPTNFRLPNDEVGLSSETPVWGCSLPGVTAVDGVSYTPPITRILRAAAHAGVLNLTLDPWHLLTFIQHEEAQPALLLTGRVSMERLVGLLEELGPAMRPSELKHHWPTELGHAELLEDVRQLGVHVERVKSRDEQDKDVTKKAALQGIMYAMHNGKLGLWSEGSRTWSLIAKGTGPNVLVESGWKPDLAKKAMTRLPTAVDFRFCPDSTERVVEVQGDRYLNEFAGMPMVPVEGSWGLIYQLIAHLLDHDSEGIEYFLDWLAAPLQRLYAGEGSQRNLSAIVLHGAQGTGKGWLTEVLREIYGRYLMVIGQGNLEDAFDPGKMRSLLFLVCNEVTSNNNRDDKTMNRLKAWITEDRVSIRKMQREAFESPIHFNMMFTSNSSRPVRLEHTDRRYSVWVQDRKMPEALIAKLRTEKMVNKWGVVPHFLAMLLSRPITRKFWEPYVNRARTTLMENSQDSTVAFARTVRDLGIDSVARDYVLDEQAKINRARGRDEYSEPVEYKTESTDQSPGCFVHYKALSSMYDHWRKRMGYKHRRAWREVKAALLTHIPGTSEGRGSIAKQYGRGINGLPENSEDERSLYLAAANGAVGKPPASTDAPAPTLQAVPKPPKQGEFEL